MLAIEVEADGFLRHMVRAIVGTLVEVGRGWRPAEDMAGRSWLRGRRESGRSDRTGPRPVSRPRSLRGGLNVSLTHCIIKG